MEHLVVVALVTGGLGLAVYGLRKIIKKRVEATPTKVDDYVYDLFEKALESPELRDKLVKLLESHVGEKK